MKKQFYPRRRKPGPNLDEQKALKKTAHLLPDSMKKYLENKAYQNRTTVSLLLQVAIDNEMESSNPFELDLDISNIPYENVRTDKTHKLYNYIRDNPDLSLEYLVMLYRDIGLASKKEVLIAHRYLLREDLIQALRPFKSSNKYPDTHFVYAIKLKEPKGVL